MQNHPILTLDENAGALPESSRQACALRDFFLARDAGEMAAAAARIEAAGGGPAPAELRSPEGMRRAEYAFNRLFVGPMALQAPPFASVYLDPEPLVMGGTTLTVREVYHALGLASTLEGVLPDDHIGLELDCAATMRAGLERVRDPLLSELHAWFVAEHMAAWVPSFVRRVEASPKETSGPADPVVDYCVGQLVHWLVAEVAAINEERGVPQSPETDDGDEAPSPVKPVVQHFAPRDTAAESGDHTL